MLSGVGGSSGSSELASTGMQPPPRERGWGTRGPGTLRGFVPGRGSSRRVRLDRRRAPASGAPAQDAAWARWGWGWGRGGGLEAEPALVDTTQSGVSASRGRARGGGGVCVGQRTVSAPTPDPASSTDLHIQLLPHLRQALGKSPSPKGQFSPALLAGMSMALLRLSR